MSNKYLASVVVAAGVVAILAVATQAYGSISYRDVIMEEWQAFKLSHNKSYGSLTEENFRLKTFLDNRLNIAKHNQRAANKVHPFTLSLNKYSDLTYSEYKKMNGFHGPKKAQLNKRKVAKLNLDLPFLHEDLPLLPEEELPRKLDWRRHGYVTPVKDQGQCGSCWAFSSTGALEGQHYRTTGNLISLSEQNLMDCSTKYGNNGCSGGLMEFAFEYIRDNHGVDTENSYPYEAHDDKCRFKNRTIGAVDKGFLEIPVGDERRLMQVLASRGPVSVAIDASQESFRFYDAGVYDEPQCGNQAESLDHGVLVVGYGHDIVGGDYWLVKNSWGESWGDSGYIKMARNKDNQCGIATSAVYPLV